MMYKIYKRSIVIAFIFATFFSCISYASENVIYDKKGRLVTEIIRPSAERKDDPDAISDALRRTTDPEKNINSSSTIITSGIDSDILSTDTKSSEGITIIRHLSSINHLDNAYELIEDREADRLKIKIMLDHGIIYAKSGFYEVDNKLYYFDDNGHMVLGPCIDNQGNTYMFSYETGELIDTSIDMGN